VPWFKVDDGFAFHRKAIRAGNTALGLWVRAGSWCAQQLTDGHVPEEMLALLGGTVDDADDLVKATLWITVEDGYQFADWGDYQPTKADVEEERAKARERQKEWRKNRGNAGSNAVTSGVTNAVTDGVTATVTDIASHAGSNGAPSLPFPSTPIPSVNGARKRATRRPSDWQPNDTHKRIAADLDLDIAAEVEQFHDFHDSKGSSFIDWDAAFRTWLRKSRDFGSSRYRPQGIDWQAQLAMAEAAEEKP
jgi:hypothetical protein